MSLLLKALKQADRGSHLSLEPMEQGKMAASAPPASAKAAADLMFEKHAAAEKRRMLFLLGTLAAVVMGMGVYFYLAVFMPWVFVPKPPLPRPVAPVAAPSPAPARVEILPPLAPTPPPAASAPPVAAPVASLAPIPPQRPTLSAKPRIARDAMPRVAAPEADIQISGGSSSSANALMAAYQSLQDGRLDDARRAYEKLRALEPRNPDVLLGLALIAQRQGRSDDAVQFYLKTLDADPKNTFAQASLTGMIARADPAAAETKFKSLIAQQPAAFLSFGLGTVYAAQGRWNEAQNAYFDAQRLEPDSPDYAFNLAISLEHIKQTRAALDYYQRALKLAQVRGGAAFDVAQARARIQHLSSAK
jgi:tetratricopeptide (TPR) repeat protein